MIRFRRLASDVKLLVKGNIRVLAIRGLLLTMIAGLSGGLESLFVKEVLGADAVVLGTLNSIWSAVFLSFILIGGWISDHYDQKIMLVAGMALTLPNPIIFALAADWRVIVIANILGALGGALTAPAYVALLFSSSEQRSRSRSIALMNTLTSLANVFVPPLGAIVIQVMGGLDEIRNMFLIQFFLSVGVWIYTYKALKSRTPATKAQRRGLTATVRGISGQMKHVYKLSKKRRAAPWLLLALTGPWAWEVVAPFWVIYAAEVCGSSLMILGFLPAVGSLTAALLLLPLANVSDRKGRKKVILLTRPFLYACMLFLLLAGTFRGLVWAPFIPLLAWIFRAIGQSSSPSWTAASTEVIPEEFQSEWQATRDFLSRLMAIPASIIGGFLWNLDPRLPFLFALLADGLVRFPVLIYAIPETLIAHSHPKPLGLHIVVYGLSGSGQTSIARLVQRELSAEIVDDSMIRRRPRRGLEALAFEKEDDKNIEKKIGEILTQKRETVVMEGKPALFAARAKDKTTRILLVASKEERVRRESNKSKAPEFVVQKELEDKDREVSRITRRLYGADFSKLPPFDVAIDTERVPPQKVAEIVKILRRINDVEKTEVSAS